MKVRDLMTREIVSVAPDSTVAEVVRLMNDHGVSSVIVDRSGPDEPWGILTKSDIVYRVAAKGVDPARLGASSIMVPALITVDPGLDVGYANRLMRRLRIKHLPVVEHGRLLGVLCQTDVLRVFELVRNVPLFERLAIDDLIALLSLSSLREYEAGEVLIEEGSSGRDLYLIESGEVIILTRRAGRIARARRGEILGEMELFGGLRSATVRVTRRSRVLVIDGGRFLQLALSRQQVGAVVFESMTRILSGRLKRANRLLFLRGIWTHRRLVLRTTLIAAGAFVLLVLATATVSETPATCPTCHNMEPYHRSWADSKHAKVKCTKCHWTYGLRGAVRGKVTGVAMAVRFLTQTYDPKPDAEVQDAACVASGCHPDIKSKGRYGGGTVESRFDHARHLIPMEGVGPLHCTSCHGHRGQDEHFSVTPSSCFLCHFQRGTSHPTPCRGCHSFQFSRQADSVPGRIDHAALRKEADCRACHGIVAEGTGKVDAARCTSCHLKPDTLSVAVMHKRHVAQAGLDCFDCHGEIIHPGSRTKMLAQQCEECHAGAHDAQERLYLGEGGTGLTERPALMFYYHVECTACHRHTEGGSVCLECHDSSSEAKARIQSAQVAKRLASARSSLREMERRIDRGRSARSFEAEKLVEEARRSIEIVQADPSAGYHNYRYAEDLLNNAEERLREAGAILVGGNGGQP